MPQEMPKKGECLAPHQPSDMTRRFVENGVLNGFSHKQIANVIDVCEDTLRKHYAKELACAKEMLITRTTDRLRQAFLFNEEMLEKDPKTVAMAVQFFLKTKGGWKETQVVEQETTHKVDDGTLEKMKSLDIDDLINLGKGLEKSEG